MKITLENVGRKFGKEWIFKNINYRLTPDSSYAIIGQNGSGKTTLIKALTAAMPLSEGKITYYIDNKIIPPDKAYQQLWLVGPYTELIEEFSLEEIINFTAKFRKMSLSTEQIINHLGYSPYKHKQLRFFSSGMKQKIKLALAFFSQNSVLILDEPTTNLDSSNIDWYLEEIKRKKNSNTLIVIGSNQENEFSFCEEKISINRFK
jgi:ABC-type multidrug transport system ATPase subunit